MVVLGIDLNTNEVLYQTFESGLNKVIHFPNEIKPPHVDIDAVSFLNYRKYTGLLSRDTCIMMFYGVDREPLSVFLSPRYKKCGMLSDHSMKALMVSLIPSRSYQLSVYESLVIAHSYAKLR
jgi:hypothetical protein